MPPERPDPIAASIPPIEAPACEPPSNGAQAITSEVVFYNNRPVLAVDAPAAQESYRWTQVVAGLYAEGVPICTEPQKNGAQLPEHMGRVTGLWTIVAGVSGNRAKVSRPSNADTVGVAGKAVLDAHRHVPKGGVMDIDDSKLEADLRRHEFLLRCRNNVVGLVDRMDEDIARVEVSIDQMVRLGLKNVSGLLDNRELSEVLAPALLHVRGPAEQAVLTRNLVQKAFAAGRLQGQAEGKAAATPPTPPKDER